jgi:hypothetical protein
MMPVTTLARWKGGKREDIMRLAKIGKAAYSKAGVESFSVKQIASGSHVREWLVVIIFHDWAHYGRVEDALRKDAEFEKGLAELMSFSQMTDREFAVDLEL